MAGSPEDFAKKIEDFNRKAKEKAVRQLKRVSLKAFQLIVQRTPVLTGCARGNWRINFGPTPLRTFESDKTDKSGNATLSEGSQQILGNTQLGVRINMVNSAPYIQRLEHGYSVQSPNGMVHITVREIETELGRTTRF